VTGEAPPNYVLSEFFCPQNQSKNIKLVAKISNFERILWKIDFLSTRKWTSSEIFSCL